MKGKFHSCLWKLYQNCQLLVLTIIRQPSTALTISIIQLMKPSGFYLNRKTGASPYRNSIAILPSETIHNYTSPDFHGNFYDRKSFDLQNMPKMVTNLVKSQQRFQGQQIRRHQNQKTTISSLRSTLTDLQNKITNAKKKLQLKKNIISNQQQDEEVSIQMDKSQKSRFKFEKTNTNVSSNKNLINVEKLLQKTKSLDTLCSQQHKGYYIMHMPHVITRKDFRAIQHLAISIHIQKEYLGIKSLSFSQIQERKVNLGKNKTDRGKKTLVIGLDDTLLHCSDSSIFPYDITIPINSKQSSFSRVYISLRPYMIGFLKRISKLYEIVAFTTRYKNEADVILDEIDPNHEYFKHRLYRKSCIQISQNNYAKDLRIINRELCSMILVDSSPSSYIFQPENCIPILPYVRGQDSELRQLQKYLQELSGFDDVRQINKKTFKIHQYWQFNDPEDLARDLYLND